MRARPGSCGAVRPGPGRRRSCNGADFPGRAGGEEETTLISPWPPLRPGPSVAGRRADIPVVPGSRRGVARCGADGRRRWRTVRYGGAAGRDGVPAGIGPAPSVNCRSSYVVAVMPVADRATGTEHLEGVLPHF